MICTQSDIADLEKSLGFKFPASYRSFLLSPPKGLEFDTDVVNDPKDHASMREIADKILAEDGRKPLPKNFFPFFTWQEDNFTAFKLGAGDNPPVISYVGCVGQEKFPSFTAWLEHQQSLDADDDGEDETPGEETLVQGDAKPEDVRSLAKDCVYLWECGFAAGSGLELTVDDPDPVTTMLEHVAKGIRIEKGPFKRHVFQNESLKSANWDAVKRHIKTVTYGTTIEFKYRR